MLLLLIPILPGIAAIIQLCAVAYAKKNKLQKPGVGSLVTKSFVYGAIGALISLLLTVAWMFWYEYSSGFGAGNWPAGWILFYGPLSFAIGQVCALTKWWSNAL